MKTHGRSKQSYPYFVACRPRLLTVETGVHSTRTAPDPYASSMLAGTLLSFLLILFGGRSMYIYYFSITIFFLVVLVYNVPSCTDVSYRPLRQVWKFDRASDDVTCMDWSHDSK